MEESGRRIHETLGELHEELKDAENLDAEAREELHTAMEEIRQVLDGSEAGERSLLDRLSDFALRVEGSHPKLAAAVGRLAQTLGELGI